MILGFELTLIGREHVPFNSAMLQTIALAFPNEEVRFYAAEGHLAELRLDSALAAHSNVVLCPISVALHRPSDPRRLPGWWVFWRIFRNLEAGLADAQPNEKHLIVLFGSTTPAIFAASLFARRCAPRLAGVQVVLHSNLNRIDLNWLIWHLRPWRDAIRRLAASTALLRAHKLVSFLALETSIKSELERRFPSIARRTDALPHPASVNEFSYDSVQTLCEPIRIGFPGRPVGSRGGKTFQKLADAFQRKYGDRMEFRFIGFLKTGRHRSSDTESMPRPEYIAGLLDIHYVLLPLFLGSYTLSPSGGLMDALTFRKPLIVTATPYVRQLFEEFGDIGFLCEEKAQFEAALESIMGLDQERYARQIHALDRARASRAPAVLAPRYRAIAASRFK